LIFSCCLCARSSKRVSVISSRAAWQPSRRAQYEGETVALAPPEYVIVRKLEYYREGGSERHLRDLRSILAVSGEQLDQLALEDWIQRRGLQTEWKLVSCIIHNFGYSRFNLMRASSVVKRMPLMKAAQSLQVRRSVMAT
jgi:hypothetical protein